MLKCIKLSKYFMVSNSNPPYKLDILWKLYVFDCQADSGLLQSDYKESSGCLLSNQSFTIFGSDGSSRNANLHLSGSQSTQSRTVGA